MVYHSISFAEDNNQDEEKPQKDFNVRVMRDVTLVRKDAAFNASNGNLGFDQIMMINGNLIGA